ncbi:hypothetical protein ACETRX_30245 [Labrys portucalensis]|uniref:Uncharacterized protein n=1 Tax=Labrys neptuniae TaxID=376174 RepID=A0ABV6ZP28_9HYPH
MNVEFDKFILDSKKNNGDSWIRILGEIQEPYNEACIWVLVKDRDQSAEALEKITPFVFEFQEKYKNFSVTVSFTIKNEGRIYETGTIESDQILNGSAQEIIESEWMLSRRDKDIFDYVKD